MGDMVFAVLIAIDLRAIRKDLRGRRARCREGQVEIGLLRPQNGQDRPPKVGGQLHPVSAEAEWGRLGGAGVRRSTLQSPPNLNSCRFIAYLLPGGIRFRVGVVLTLKFAA